MPKTNAEYIGLKDAHNNGAIPPTPFFLTAAGSLIATSGKLKCFSSGGTEVEAATSIDVIWSPDTTAWTTDKIEIMFGNVSYDSTKCGYIEFSIPSMKAPPNTKATFATFKLKILTNRSLNHNGTADEKAGKATTANYVNGH